jgi:hypothetical protein
MPRTSGGVAAVKLQEQDEEAQEMGEVTRHAKEVHGEG